VAGEPAFSAAAQRAMISHPADSDGGFRSMVNEVQVRPEIQQEIERQVQGQSGAILDRLAERLRGAANAAAVYGTPVVRDGVTVIPVAKVRWGFGGGGGTGRSPGGNGAGSGEGGGGGVLATPMGYIEMRDGGTEFKQINDPITMLIVPPIIIAAGITATLVLRGLRLLIRR
jgi:uncharacterized spore protein YtfJ